MLIAKLNIDFALDSFVLQSRKIIVIIIMDPGWFFLFLFFLVEVLLVTLLCLPMPSNEIRGVIVRFIVNMWETRPVRITSLVMLGVNVIYFWFVCDALLHPLFDFGLIQNPFAEGHLTCEAKQNLFWNERNAYLTGMSIFLFIVLNRMVDIQDKLFQARGEVKRNSVVAATAAYSSTNGDNNKEKQT